MALQLFTAQKGTVSKHNIGAGLTVAVVATSFVGTQSTLTVQSPLAIVASAQLYPVSSDSTGAGVHTTPDSFLLTNSLNSSGYVTLIANSTNQSDTLVPTGLVFQRNGTNGQDCICVLFGRA